MAEYLIQDTTLSAIAEAIRNKTGKADNITPEQMPTEIMGITTGGGEGEKPFDCHSVTFVYNDKSYVRSVADGDTCADPVERGLIPTPTKQSTAQYNYTFYGWGASDGGAADANILKNITADKTVYAIFTATVRYYTITWLDSDGVTELPGQKQWAYGTVPSYAPTKDGAVFTGWNTEPVAVTGDATYIATWQEIVGGSMTSTMSWRLADGLLTISGTGAMPSYNTINTPWNKYRNDITSVVVEEGVTSLGSYFLYSCANVEAVELPNGLSAIGNAAFSDCTSLQNLTIPDSVTTIGNSALQNCSGMTSLVIGTGITAFESGTLRGCGKLKTLVLPFLGAKYYASRPNNDYYPFGYVFGTDSYTGASATSQKYVDKYNSSKNATYYIPDSLESVTISGGDTVDGGFQNCKNIKSVTIGNGANVVGQNLFFGCAGLSSVSIPSSVTHILMQSFMNCTSLKSIVIPSGIKYIYKNAFYGCSALTSATFEVTDGWFAADTYNATSGTSVTYLANASNGALYLRKTYVDKYLIRN